MDYFAGRFLGVKLNAESKFRHMTIWNTFRLKTGNAQTRQKAIDRLMLSKSLKSVELLVGCLADEDAMVRRAAANAFNRITDQRAINALIKSLDDENWEVRAAAATALGRQGDQRGLAPLVAKLRDQKGRVRCCAASSLRKLGWKTTDKLEHALFEIALGNPKAAARSGADAVESLTSELSHNTSFFRRAVAEVLKDLNDPRAVKSLLKAALHDDDITVHIAAIYGLASVNHEEVVPVLQMALRSSDERVRLAAVTVLVRIADTSFADRFVELLKDNHFEVRLAAVNFLSRLRDAKYADVLITMLWDHDHDVREAAAKALGAMRTASATEPLVVALVDEEHSVRLAAAKALSQIDERWIFSEAAQRARAKLELSMSDGRSWVRSATVELLEKLKAPARVARAAA